jgi:hypothetical protein
MRFVLGAAIVYLMIKGRWSVYSAFATTAATQ